MEYLTSEMSKNQFKSSKAAMGFRKTPESHRMFMHINNCTYKLSSSLFKDSKTNEWTLSAEQDPKQFRAEMYLIFITQSLCSFLLTLRITRKKGGYVRLTNTSCWVSLWYFTFTLTKSQLWAVVKPTCVTLSYALYFQLFNYMIVIIF